MSGEKKNEGEGSRTADRLYRDAATNFAKETDTLLAGLEAGREVEGNKGAFDRAEQAGRSRSKGDLKRDLDGTDFDLERGESSVVKSAKK
jgi:hypothetical protein